jgi:micrococcal nuclease
MKKSVKRLVFLAFAVVIILVVISLLLILNQPRGPIYYKVARVVDGDTILLENKQTIRYLGIDTPELHHPTIGVECGGLEASMQNQELLAGKRVRLISDVTDRDSYGRLLRYVFTEDGTFVNYELIRGGYGQVFQMQPDHLFTNTFTQAQMEAKKEGSGLWRTCYNLTK